MTIAEYIQQDLAHRIASGGDVPAPLTLNAIASTYGVSATPVRRAVETLVSSGALERLDNGRLRIAKARRRPKGRKANPPPKAPTDWEDVIGRHVLTRAVTGREGPLIEEELCDRFQIGRGVLRRALWSLSGGGLVEHVQRRGWRVAAFDAGDCLDFIAVRATLEVQALDLARGRLEAAALERMIRGNGPDAAASGQIDNDLHGYIVERSGNRYIQGFFDAHGRDYRRLFDQATVSATLVSEMAAGHVAILEHALHRRWARARAELAAHIEAQGPILAEMIDDLRAKPSD